MDPLEQRHLMAVLGPQLIAIEPDNGPDLLLGQTRTEAPRELTFRFNPGQAIDPVTLGSIQIVRGGEDGILNGIGDVAVRPGYVAIGDFPNEVVVRFRDALPQDQYQITIVGTDPAPLRNTAGLPFQFDTTTGLGANQVVTMNLDLGPRLVSVVPQPVDRDPTTGALTQRTNQIDVYFDHRDPLDPTLAQNASLYQLILTQETATNVDDTVQNPTSVSYNAATGKAILTFAAPLPTGTYRLRIGDNAPLSPAPLADPFSGLDSGDSFLTAFNLTTLNNSTIISQAIDPQTTSLVAPGANDEPGHRQILQESHFQIGPTSSVVDANPQIPTQYYHFPLILGPNPQGGNFPNVITETQKQRFREVFELYGRYMGVRFVETNDPTPFDNNPTVPNSILIGTGDLRAIVPGTVPGSVIGIGGQAVFFGGQYFSDFGDIPQGAVAVLDSTNPSWGVSEFGGNYFREAMDVVGLALGLGRANDLPDLTVLTDTLPYGNIGERVYPGDNDITHAVHRSTPNGSDIDLFQFNVTQTGTFSAETVAERLTDSSLLDSVLTLYGDVHFLRANAGSAVFDGDTFSLSDGTTTATFEFDFFDPNSTTPYVPSVQAGNRPVRFHSSFTASQVAESIAQAMRDTASLDVDPVVEFNRVLLRGGSLPTVPVGSFRSFDTTGAFPNPNLSTSREIIARNDDYYSKDSFLEVRLTKGTYYIGVSSTGNTNFDPVRTASGSGGSTQGRYDLRVNFTADPMLELRDATNRAFDGDLDGKAGGDYNFWFKADTANTLWVDKASASATQDGSIANPFKTISAAFAAATPGDIVRIVGNGGADGDFATLYDNVAYEIGFKQEVIGNNVVETPLEDGATFEVPRGVTVMVDAGAILKLRKANLDVGSSSQGANANRSEGALQLLGTPQASVFVTSFHNELIGKDTFVTVTNAVAGDFGGIVFRNDIDIAEGRALLERQGIFLNYVNHADISFGGGNVVVNSVPKAYAPIHAIVARPTVTFNTITQSKDAAISADQQSFADTKFQLSAGGISGVGNVGPSIEVTTEDDHGLVTGARVLITGVQGLSTPINSTQVSTPYTVTVTGPRTFTLNGVGPSGAYVASLGDRWVEVDSTGRAVYLTNDYQRVGPDIRGNLLSVEKTTGTSSTIQNAINAGPIAITTDFAHGLINGQAIRVSGVQGNSAANGIFNVTVTGTNTFTLNGSTGNGDYVASVGDSWQLVTGGAVTGATNAGPIEINTGTPHGLNTGDRVRIANVLGNSAANGDWKVTRTSATTFTLDGSVGNADYVPSGFDSWTKITGSGISAASTSSPISITTDTPHGLITGARVRVSGVQGNTAANGDFTVTVTGPNTFTLDGSGGNNAYIPSDTDEWTAITDNSINGMFVRIDTPFGSSTNALTVPARWDDTDIVHVLTENLEIRGTPGGSFDPDSVGPAFTEARLDARLQIDPRVIVKLEGSRIETTFGAQFLAEGTADEPIIFTSLRDDRYGIGGSFDTNRNLNGGTPAQGNWGGFFFGHNTSASIDHAVITYAGGSTRIEGGFDNFNAVAIHQADVRLTNSLLENNAGGLANTPAPPGTGLPNGNRNGRGTNASATIFVRGAQPIIVGNTIVNNAGDVININANSLQSRVVADSGRATGRLGDFTQYADNHGPLVRQNVISNNGINGMTVRGATLTTESVWDDVDMVHVLRDEIIVDNLHTYGGLRLQSNEDASLVVKLLGPTAGFTANGRPLDIEDRIGGTVQVVGTPNHPVILTSLRDDAVGAGLDRQGRVQTNTDNVNATPTAGDWRSIRLDKYSNDRNSKVINESEEPRTNVGDPRLNVNATLNTAQFIGDLAPTEKSGDDNRRLGFEVHGFISDDHPGDVDVYSFTAPAGSEVWFDIDLTTHALDTVLELVEVQSGFPNGRVVARSDDSNAEQLASLGTIGSEGLQGVGLPAPLAGEDQLGRIMQRDAIQIPYGKDFYTTNPRDAGMRVRLPGAAGTTPTYFIRVRSANANKADATLGAGQTKGAYRLQVRLNEVDEFPGSTVRYADLRFAGGAGGATAGAIEIIGLPAHSPFVGESAEVVGANNDTAGGALDLGNLLTTDRATLSVGGSIGSVGDVDFYKFTLQHDLANGPNGVATSPVVFDIDYADAISRPNTTFAVYDSTGRLILTGKDSNVVDDQPDPLSGNNTQDLSRGSFGFLDSFIGTVMMPTGLRSFNTTQTYTIAVSSDRSYPTTLAQFFNANAADKLSRLEPINSVERIAEDHIGITDNAATVTPAKTPLFGSGILDTVALNTHAAPFNLSDVVLYVQTTGAAGELFTIDPFTGRLETILTDGAADIDGNGTGYLDIAMRNDGRLFSYTARNTGTINAGQTGNYTEFDLGTGVDNIGADDAVDVVVGGQVPQNHGTEYEAMTFTPGSISGRALYAVGQQIGGPGRNLLYRMNPTTGVEDLPNQTTPADPSNPLPLGELVTAGNVPLPGIATGMAYNPATNRVYYVTSDGRFYQATVGSRNLTEIPLTNVGAPGFTGLTSGPANVENSAYAQILFATGSDGRLYAFNTAGVGQSIFATAAGPLSPLRATSVAIASAGGGSIEGLAFSTLDYNLWHVTDRRGSLSAADEGHGMYPTYDTSRITRVAGGSSYYFGIEDPRVSQTISAAEFPDWGNYTATNAGIFNTYNLPGGAKGSLTTNTFSLDGYSQQDRPTLYFNYFLDTQNANSAAARDRMLDAARVYLSDDGGLTWNYMLATNNSLLDPTFEVQPVPPAFEDTELPEFLSHDEQASLDPRQRIQELFDNTGTWRQARISLGEFAGKANLKLRFDFSTSSIISDFNSPGFYGQSPSFGSSDQFADTRQSNRMQGIDNAHEGFYVDDVIIGFAERGEMITNNTVPTTGFSTSPVDPIPDFGQNLTGEYQLEIRRGTEYGGVIAGAVNVALVESFDTQDRLSQGFTLFAPVNAYSQTQGSQSVTSNATRTFTFTGTPPAGSEGVLTITANGSLRLSSQYLTIGYESLRGNEDVFRTGGKDNTNVVTTIVLTEAQLDAWAANGSITITVTGSADVVNANVTLNLSYQSVQQSGLDGEQFSINDGLDSVTFEFDNSVGSPVVNSGTRRVQIPVQDTDSPSRVASSMADAINAANLAGLFKVTAKKPAPTSIRVDLFGAGFVDVTAAPSIARRVFDLMFPNLSPLLIGTVDPLNFTLTGDRNQPREQGQIVIETTTVSDSSGYGIMVDAGARDVGNSLPHPGAVRNLRELNAARLAPSIVIENNLLFRNTVGGILFSGDATGGNVPLAAIPFGRILNNTIFGNTQILANGQAVPAPLGTGISVTQNASPTVINNIVSNLVTGVSIDASSQAAGTVLGATLYKGNTTDFTTGAIGVGTFPLQLGPGDPLFVDPLVLDRNRGNFYLAPGSQAIDASVISLEDRPEMTKVAAPSGIAESPIFAPTSDLLGNPRLDDPTVAPPFFGLGENPFTDRGALEKVNTLTITDVTLDEEVNGVASVFQFIVSLTRITGDIVTVVFNTGDGTAATGADYNGRSGTLTFGPGESTKFVTVQIQGDTVDEVDETFFVNLTNAVNAVVADPQGIGTILDNDAPPDLLIGNRTLPEGNSGTTNFVFDLSLSAPSGRPIPVVFNTQDGSAMIANMDYIASTGTVTFAPGTVSQKITVQVVGDSSVEVDETFTVTVNVPTPGLVNSIPMPATGTIQDDDTKISIANPTINVNEGTNPPDAATQDVVVLVTLPGASTQQITVPYTTIDGLGLTGATAPSDYTAITDGTLTFAPGVRTQGITVTINADSMTEADERFTVQLGTPTNAILDPVGSSFSTITIINDDGPPVASIGNAAPTLENSPTMTFPVTLTAPTASELIITYKTVDGTATAGSDYVGVAAGQVTFNAGEASKDITITLTDDTVGEADETFSVMLTGPAGSLGANTTGTGTIIDNEIKPSIAIAGVTMDEGNSGFTQFRFAVTLDMAPTAPVSAVFTTEDGTASSGSDYNATTGTLSFGIGETFKEITVQVIGDTQIEPNESFLVKLSNFVGLGVTTSQATGLIVNDDGIPTVSISDASVTEGSGTTVNAVFTVTLSEVPMQPVSVPFSTANGSAIAPGDYTAVSGVLTFSGNETVKTITVPIVGDFLSEINETFSVNIGPITNGRPGKIVGNGIIVDNDAAGLLVTGAGATGGPHVRALDSVTLAEKFSFFAYNPGFTGGVRVAQGDINGDGQPDIITAPGAGGGPHVRAFDGKTGAVLLNFFAFDGSVTTGLTVAAGDVNLDGHADVIVGIDGPGAQPRVRVYNGVNLALIRDQVLPPAFSGGVRVAAGDINGDGRADVIAGAGAGNTPRVLVFDAMTGATMADFFAYTPAFGGGIYVAAGDVNGDGKADIVTGAGQGGGPHVRVFDGVTRAEIRGGFVYNAGFTGGVRVSTTDINGDGRADIITGAGVGGGPHVQVLDAHTFAQYASYFAYTPGFTGGIYVGGSFAARKSPLLADELGGGSSAVVEANQLQPLVDQAIASWAAARHDADLSQELRGIKVEVADLPDNTLALAFASSIVVDRDAAGHGWFVDDTPADSQEFDADGHALAGRSAAGHMDLLSVLAHEFGHVLGLDDLDLGSHAGDLMAEALAAGMRRSPVDAVDALFGDDGWE
jgi:hypothetical protein